MAITTKVLSRILTSVDRDFCFLPHHPYRLFKVYLGGVIHALCPQYLIEHILFIKRAFTPCRPVIGRPGDKFCQWKYLIPPGRNINMDARNKQQVPSLIIWSAQNTAIGPIKLHLRVYLCCGQGRMLACEYPRHSLNEIVLQK